MTVTTANWVNIILKSTSPEVAWQELFETLQEVALESASPVQLHKDTVAPDRLMAESAWNLWQAYLLSAPRTSKLLKDWWENGTYNNSAVLILDAFSLRELPILLEGAKTRGIVPVSVRVTGSEVPSDTDQFAYSLGIATRSSLRNNGAPSSFIFKKPEIYTDVLDYPFEDCISSIPYVPNLFIWHTWLDDLVHLHKRLPEQIHKASQVTLRSDGFWGFINRLRQGRRLIVTADHGYAESKQFSTEAQDKEEIKALRDILGASRYRKVVQPWNWSFMPPVVLTVNDYYVVIGQKKWAVQAGFPEACHGGLSLLEVAVPFIEFPPLGAQ